LLPWNRKLSSLALPSWGVHSVSLCLKLFC